jgi:hypothetical protein
MPTWKIVVATGLAVALSAAIWRFTEPTPVGLASSAAAVLVMARPGDRRNYPFLSRQPVPGTVTDAR